LPWGTARRAGACHTHRDGYLERNPQRRLALLVATLNKAAPAITATILAYVVISASR
jgi:hypothetical protein